MLIYNIYIGKQCTFAFDFSKYKKIIYNIDNLINNKTNQKNETNLQSNDKGNGPGCLVPHWRGECMGI